MTHKDSNIDQLYQEGNKAQPPKDIDDAIMARAQQANQPTRLGPLRPWLAAASILFAVPILWLMLGQPELQQARQESLQPVPVPSVPLSMDSAKPDTEAKPTPSAETDDPQDSEADQSKITASGARIRYQDPESETAGLNAPAPAEKRNATAEQEAVEDNLMDSTPASYLSLNSEKQKTSESMEDLIEQLKPDKLTETELALWQSLEQQVKNQQWSEARQTLKQLKQQHPSLDISRLEDRLEYLLSEFRP
ncbi:hypothetical protein GCM10011365_14990 [Marinicella pacifica]|uniref:Uncharacterized protein n=1 Tax=Marinicella pacifica TaxID=1171543 RepID=A0A917CNW5_9GAMM|nr:hypothetical protein [Marinicella pacifica]GGF94682.1 hypothetical protein GCM10011365_14990 [Marinicella pacifica]